MCKNIKLFNFNNTYLDLPNIFYKVQTPVFVDQPKMFYFNDNLAKDLRIDIENLDENILANIFSGNIHLKGTKSISQAYAGHQFGNFTMLGDGRAVLLGEHIINGNRYDIQLKGSGKTAYSRNGDGKATLSSMLREYIFSESMNLLKIPTTRSLSVVSTGEKIYRLEKFEGGILTRVASSHIRVGTFEYAARYCTLDEYKLFFNYVINRHFPYLIDKKILVVDFLNTVMEKQIKLLVNWYRVGFIHGVMNTDNMSIAGETIDYGPCAFMNRYNPSTVFSSIDRNGRYSFKNQSRIAYWNLVVLANTLIPLITNNKKEAIVLIQNVLDSFNEKYTKKWYEMMFKKIGIIDPESNDNTYVDELLKLMKIHNFDYTNLFASLTLGGSFIDKFYENQDFKIWYKKWVFRIRKSNNLEAGKDFMKNNNPLYIPRNYLVESALENAILKDCDKMKTLLSDISKSYSYDTFKGDLHTVPDNFDSSYVTYCGT